MSKKDPKLLLKSKNVLSRGMPYGPIYYQILEFSEPRGISFVYRRIEECMDVAVRSCLFVVDSSLGQYKLYYMSRVRMLSLHWKTVWRYVWFNNLKSERDVISPFLGI